MTSTFIASPPFCLVLQTTLYCKVHGRRRQGRPATLGAGLPIQLRKSTPGVPMRFAVLLVAGFLAAPVLSAQHAVPSDGQWLIEPGEHSGTVRLTIRYGERRYHDSWNNQDDVPMSQLVGLSAADMGGSG